MFGFIFYLGLYNLHIGCIATVSSICSFHCNISEQTSDEEEKKRERKSKQRKSDSESESEEEDSESESSQSESEESEAEVKKKKKVWMKPSCTIGNHNDVNLHCNPPPVNIIDSKVSLDPLQAAESKPPPKAVKKEKKEMSLLDLDDCEHFFISWSRLL